MANSSIRRSLTAVVGAVLIATTQQSFIGVAQSSVSSPLQRVEATRADSLRTWDRYIVDGERSGRLRVRLSRADPDVPARQLERLDQYHDGVRIWGADLVRNSERGTAMSIFGVVAEDLVLPTHPRLTASEAAASMERAGGPDARVDRTPELLVLPLDSGEYRLAYEGMLHVPTDADVVHLFVDANTGSELMRYSAIQRQSAVGTGRGVLGDQKKLSVARLNSSYVTWDQLRPPTIFTYDFRGDLTRFKNFQQGRINLSPSDLASKSDNVWTDPAVVDAHAHTGMALDYFYKRFNRRGIDDRNRPINVLTNAMSQQAALFATATDLSSYGIQASALSTGFSDYLFFGNGLPAGVFLTNTGQNTTYTAGALDIVAHELTHLVLNHSSDLIYRNEAGALNEAFADMMGKGAEFFYRSAGTGPGQADYTVAKDTDRAVRPGALNGIRSMANPTAFGDPDHYFIRSWRLGANNQPVDNGYVHTNSGIANHAFYLAIEGGTHRLSRLAVQGVGAANRAQVERSFFRAFTLLMPSNSTFVTARSATTQAARDLYGAGSAVERAIDQAWAAVGVPTASSVATVTDAVAARFGRVYAYQFPRSGMMSSNLLAINETTDLDIYAVLNTPACTTWRGLGAQGQLLVAPSCVLAASDSAVGWETVRMNVSAGQTVALWIVNLSPSTQMFRLETFVE